MYPFTVTYTLQQVIDLQTVYARHADLVQKLDAIQQAYATKDQVRNIGVYAVCPCM